jgi:hypothetical protein
MGMAIRRMTNMDWSTVSLEHSSLMDLDVLRQMRA